MEKGGRWRPLGPWAPHGDPWMEITDLCLLCDSVIFAQSQRKTILTFSRADKSPVTDHSKCEIQFYARNPNSIGQSHPSSGIGCSRYRNWVTECVQGQPGVGKPGAGRRAQAHPPISGRTRPEADSAKGVLSPWETGFGLGCRARARGKRVPQFFCPVSIKRPLRLTVNQALCWVLGIQE